MVLGECPLLPASTPAHSHVNGVQHREQRGTPRLDTATMAFNSGPTFLLLDMCHLSATRTIKTNDRLSHWNLLQPSSSAPASILFFEGLQKPATTSTMTSPLSPSLFLWRLVLLCPGERPLLCPSETVAHATRQEGQSSNALFEGSG